MEQKKQKLDTVVADQNGDSKWTPLDVPETHYQLVPPDNHPGRLIQVIDIGTRDGDYGPNHRVVLVFELPETSAVFNDERGPEPFCVRRWYPLNLSKKSDLGKDLRTWLLPSVVEKLVLTKNFGPLLGKQCLVNVIHEPGRDGDLREKIVAITACPKGMGELPEPINDVFVYSIKDGRGGAFERLSKGFQDLVLKSNELTGAPQPSRKEIGERNLETATRNAIAEAEQDESDESESDEIEMDPADPAGFIDALSDEELRDPETAARTRGLIDGLAISNGERLNLLAYLANLVRRAIKAKPASVNDAYNAGDEVPL